MKLTGNLKCPQMCTVSVLHTYKTSKSCVGIQTHFMRVLNKNSVSLLFVKAQVIKTINALPPRRP